MAISCIIFCEHVTQSVFTSSNLTTETLEQGLKNVQSLQ